MTPYHRCKTHQIKTPPPDVQCDASAKADVQCDASPNHPIVFNYDVGVVAPVNFDVSVNRPAPVKMATRGIKLTFRPEKGPKLTNAERVRNFKERLKETDPQQYLELKKNHNDANKRWYFDELSY